jgi:hypothetical protein
MLFYEPSDGGGVKSKGFAPLPFEQNCLKASGNKLEIAAMNV